ncbi:hypothetical protein ACO0K1_13075 [Undibacterium sp. SXout20W]
MSGKKNDFLRTLKAIFAVTSGLMSLNVLATEKQLIAYNTYDSEPFVTTSGGLGADLVAYLNSRLSGKYHFTLQTVPRMKLNQSIINARSFNGIVLFLNPNFVVDTNKKFYWTDAFMRDENYVVSNIDKKVNYTGPDSLSGTKFGGIKGYHYLNLDSQFGEAIEREDASDEVSNLKKVAYSRIDVTIVPASSFRFFIRNASSSFADKLYVARERHYAFTRHIFCASADAELAKLLANVATDMKTDKRWLDVLNAYGLNELKL